MNVRILGGPYDNDIYVVSDNASYIKAVEPEEPTAWISVIDSTAASLKIVIIPIENHVLLGPIARWEKRKR